MIEKDMLTRAEAAAWLRVHVRTIDRLVAVKELLPVRVGKRVLVPRAALEFYVERRLKAAMEAGGGKQA